MAVHIATGYLANILVWLDTLRYAKIYYNNKTLVQDQLNSTEISIHWNYWSYFQTIDLVASSQIVLICKWNIANLYIPIKSIDIDIAFVPGVKTIFKILTFQIVTWSLLNISIFISCD